MDDGTVLQGRDTGVSKRAGCGEEVIRKHHFTELLTVMMPSAPLSSHKEIIPRKRSRMIAAPKLGKRPGATYPRAAAPPAAKKTTINPVETVPKKPCLTQEPTPVSVLKLILSKSEGGKEILKRPSRCAFSKPSQECVDAYNLRAVRAIREKNVPLLRTMLEEGISLDACNRFGESLIHMACRRGDVNVVRFLLLEGRVNIHVRDDFGRTPLHDACWTAEPNFGVMDVLLEHAPTSLLLAEDVRGHTPFHYARKEHWESWVSYLGEREAKLTALLNVRQVVG